MRRSGIAALLYAAAPVAATVAVFVGPLAGMVVVAAPTHAQQLHIAAYGGQCGVVMRSSSPGTMKYPDCAGD